MCIIHSETSFESKSMYHNLLITSVISAEFQRAVSRGFWNFPNCILDGFGWQDSTGIMMQRLLWRTHRGLLYWFGERRVGSSFSTSAFFEPNGCPNACEHRRSKCPYSASNQSFSECKSVLISSCIVGALIRLMEEILQQLIWQISHYWQGISMYFIHVRWCRISSINSSFL